MKYGKLEDISGVDFSLPQEPASNASVLSGVPAQTDIRLGGTMWNVPAWVGNWFPPNTRPAEFLHCYSRIFSTIELNATHYRIPTPETVRKWRSETPSGFMFCPKFPQTVSHYRRFRNCEEPTDQFLTAILEFREQLGPSFIQLPPHFSPSSADDLMAYLHALPADLHVAVEFRHTEWFASGVSAVEAMWDFMAERGITAVISDTAGRRDAVHLRLTSPHTIVRFGGNALHSSDYQRLTDWAERAVQWASHGLLSFHLWMHQPDSVVSPESCVWFAEEWQRLTGMQTHVPARVAQTSLF
ncbi:MAG: DUF72 domain-containing protein [Flavobacteriales bacterium]|jgi:uncharacterized protein YecE (DUF72 family)